MTEETPLPPELQKLVEKRRGTDRREKKIHVSRERRTGRDRRKEERSKQK